MGKRKKFELFPYLMALPAFICIAVICLYSVFSGIATSFTNASLTNIDNADFVGLENYIKVFSDKEFGNALAFTLLFTLGSVALSFVLGLVCALMMNRKMRLRSMVRAMLLLPWVVPAVVGTTSWLWILNDQTGIINIILQNIGLIEKPILFLGTANMSKLTVILFATWKSFPFMALVILSALQGIPTDIYEASTIDGANALQNFWRITMPMIRRESLLAVLLMTIWNFNNFDFVYMMTKGGPALATQGVSIYSYHLAFSRNNLAYASTIAVIMMLLMIVVSVVYFRVNDSRKED